MAYKRLTKQQWNSLPAYKKYQMRARTPDLYNYYQDRYKPKAEPVAAKERDTGTVKRSADGTFNPDDSKAERVDKSDIASFLNDYYGQNDPTGQDRTDDEYYDTLPQEMQWLIEDQAEFSSLVNRYLEGDITYEELQEFELSDYGDAGTKFVEFYEEMQTLLLSEQAPVEEAAGPTQSEILGGKGAVRRYDKEGNLVRITYDGEDYKQDDSGQWVAQAPQESTGNGGVTVLPGTITTTEPDTSEETKVDPYIPYELPENEEVDVTELTEEQQTDIWGKIKEGLGKIPGAVGKVIFGPDGMPTNVDEWIEWVDKTLQAQMGPENLPFPIVITTNPTEGTWIDLKIPINLDVNGTPIRIPLFDEDGNFVSSDELEGALLDAKGQILGPLGEIGEVFLDDEGNIKLDLGDLKDVLLEDLTLNPDGSVTGSTAAEILVGKWFFNPDSGEWEEEVEASLEEVGLDDGDEDGLADTTDDNTTTDDDELGGLFEEEEDEDPTPPAKAPRGRLIVDSDGNPVRIIGTDGTNYVLDGEGQWVAAAVGEGDGGETVLPGTTTGVTEDTDDELANDIDVPADPVDKLPDDIEEVEVVPPDQPVVPPSGPPEEPVVPPSGPPDQPVVPPSGPPDQPVVPPSGPPEEPVVPPDGPPEEPVVPPDGPPDDKPVVGGPVIVEGGPEDPTGGGDPEEPLVGKTGPAGAAGAGGAAGRDAPRGGMMGGLSYNLPGFVGVQYQPKDYTAELDRIINESLFKGMI
jgi:hypothetical protein